MKGTPVPEGDWTSLNLRLDEIAGQIKSIQVLAVTDEGLSLEESVELNEPEPTPEPPGPTPGPEVPTIHDFYVDPTTAARSILNPQRSVWTLVTAYWVTEGANMPLIIKINKLLDNKVTEIKCTKAEGHRSLGLLNQDCEFTLSAKNNNGEVTKVASFTVLS